MSLLLLEGDLLVGLAVGVAVISSWKIVKRPGLLLRGGCEVVVELAISGVEEKLAVVKEPLLRGGLKENKVAFVRFRETSCFSHLSNGD